MANVKLAKAIVAPGRTVFTGVIETTVWDPDTKRDVPSVKASGAKGPGEAVELPEEEVARLRSLGFLTDPKNPEIERQTGTSLNTNEGPRIKAQV